MSSVHRLHRSTTTKIQYDELFNLSAILLSRVIGREQCEVIKMSQVKTTDYRV